MTEFFKAFDSFQWSKLKKYYICVEDEKIIEYTEEYKEGAIEIDVQTYLKIRDNGFKKYRYKDGKLVQEIKKRTKNFLELQEDKDGLNFIQSNPFWINTNQNSKQKFFQWKTVK